MFDESKKEVHPSFAKAILSRATCSPGMSLFDSEIRHQHVVTLSISTATRERDLNHDWIFPVQEMIEIHMSESQWGALVSSMGMGDGVPVTLSRLDGKRIEEPPFQPRMAMSTDEVTTAAEKVFEHVWEAFEAAEAKPTKANLKHLRHALEGSKSNVKFATKTLSDFTEKIVNNARADIEAMMLTAAQAVGLKDPRFTAPEIGTASNLTEIPELEK